MLLWSVQVFWEALLFTSSYLATFAMAWPIHQTFHAIQSKDSKEQSRWFAFWTVMTPMMCVEASPLLVAYLPGFHAVKLVLIIWLTSSRFQGADLLYKTFVFPTLCNYENNIDSGIAVIKEKVVSTAHTIGQKGIDQVRQHSVSLLLKGHSMLAASQQSQVQQQAPAN